MADVSVSSFRAHLERVRSPSTAQKYAEAVARFLEALRDTNYTSFADLPPGILSSYAGALVGEDYSPQTIHWHLAAINRYLNWIRGQGVVVPEFHKPDNPRIKHVIRDTLAPEALPRYMQLADELLVEPTRTAVMLLPCVGLRCSEATHLPLSALRRVDLPLDGEKKSVLSLHVTGKGGDARIVPVLDEGASVLMSYLAGWRRQHKGPWVFPGNAEARIPMSNRTLREGLQKVREALSLNDLSPHTLRRTYAVSLHRRGVDPPTIAKILGHKDIQTLYKHYLALDEHDILRGVHSKGASLF